MRFIFACLAAVLAIALCSCESKSTEPEQKKPEPGKTAAVHKKTEPTSADLEIKGTPWKEDFSHPTIAETGLAATGDWKIADGAARNDASPKPQGLARGTKGDDLDVRFSYSIESVKDDGSHVGLYIRTNTQTKSKIYVRFRDRHVELGYFDGRTPTRFHNTDVKSLAGTKYDVHVVAAGRFLRVWRSTAGGKEEMIFDRDDAPAYNGDQVFFSVGENTIGTFDNISILARS